MAINELIASAGNIPWQMDESFRANRLANSNMAVQQGQLGVMQNQDARAQQTADQQNASQQQFNALLQEYLGPQQGAMAAQGMGGNNALMQQMFAANPQQTTQLLQMQAAQQAQQAAAAKAQAEQEKADALESVHKAQFVLASKSPKELVMKRFPEFAKELVDAGVDVDSLTDDQFRQMAEMTIAQFGPIAGIGPEKQGGGDTPFSKINPSEYTPESVAKFEATGKASDLRKAQSVAQADPNQSFTRANVLRDEFNTANKDYSIIQAQYGNILATAREPSAAGDISLITSYMKMLDPQSTVREGEFANAENAGGVPSKLRAQYNKLLNGQRLDLTQRADFVKQSAAIFGERQKQADKNRERYATLAKRAGVDPQDVVGAGDAPAAAAPAASGAPAVGTVQDGYRYKGGDPASQGSWEPVR